MAQEVRLGSSIDLVAKRYGVSLSFVGQACRDHGVPVEVPTGERVYLLIARLLGTDHKLAEIAAELGVSVPYVSRVYQQCRAVGIPVRERLRGRPRTERDRTRDDQSM
jgi:DNA-binding LacI/PurR family transcriptional regulator